MVKKKTEEAKTVKVRRTSVGLEDVAAMVDPAFEATSIEPGDFDEAPAQPKPRHLRAVK